MPHITEQLGKFGSINLESLNSSASFLERIDRKFLLTQWQLGSVLSELKKDFFVLEISGENIFSYDNVYMDTPEYLFYKQHQNGNPSRVKVRTRLYKDTDMAFFEFKQKQGGVTRKFRYQFPSEEHGVMTKGKKRFFQGVYMSFYWDTNLKISPAIRTSYSRMTLVHKDSSERITIDFNIMCENLRWNADKKSLPINLNNLVIVESKSMSEKSFLSKIMDRYSIKKAKSCSKYSLWVVYSGLAEKYSTFEHTMKEIKRIKQSL